MNTLRNYLPITVGTLALVGALTLTSSNTSPSDSSKDVRVVNTVGERVPILGPVEAQQHGSWLVGIAGTPNVHVISGESAVHVLSGTASPVFTRDVDNPARQPFQQFLSFSFVPSAGSAESSFFVPGGKRLVIEFATIFVELQSLDENINKAAIRTTVGGVDAIHSLTVSTQGELRFTASQQMRLYAGPSTSVAVVAFRAPFSGGGSINASISGYLVDLP